MIHFWNRNFSGRGRRKRKGTEVCDDGNTFNGYEKNTYPDTNDAIILFSWFKTINIIYIE